MDIKGFPIGFYRDYPHGIRPVNLHIHILVTRDHLAVRMTILIRTVVYRKEDNDSKIYGDFNDAVKESGAKIIVPKPGVSFEFGNALVEIYAPQEMEYNNTNNYSVALCITFGKRKFFFSGDAEEESEEQMLGLSTLPDVDVFQAGHHGSSTSNTEAFLKAMLSFTASLKSP